MSANRRRQDRNQERFRRLSATQEVLYTNQFKQADKASEKEAEHKQEHFRM